ncbi:MAG: hypothetical protein A07HN63_01842 [uncultured archaeon A07HN63]|nr:MAG: hypothetical protein A07HN63_01842 [uncultured archaeon A07HN63]
MPVCDMVLDAEVKTADSLHCSLVTAIKRGFTLETWVSGSREQVASETFVRRHTTFDSVAEFCAACPSETDTIGGIQQLSADDRDAFIARTTDFETWQAMKEGAAMEDLLSLQNI